MTDDARTTLLLIDLQNDYFPGGLNPLEGATEAVANARCLLEAFRTLGLPAVHVRHLATYPGATFFLPGSEGAAFHPAVQPGAGEVVVEKSHPNAFLETELLSHLRALGSKTLLVAGMMTHMCVDATVRAAADSGFSCSVAADACATKALAFGDQTVAATQVHAAFLAALSAAYAEVLHSAELLGRLR